MLVMNSTGPSILIRNVTMNTSSLSRRQWLTASAAAVAAASLPRAALAATAEQAKLGIQLYSLRGYNVNEALQHAADLGFAEVEFYSGMLPIDSTPDQIAAMKKRVADLGMSISAHGVNSIGSDAAANRKLFEFAHALGIPTITADPDPAAFDNLDDLVEEFDICIAIHNHGPAARYNRVVDVLKAIEGHDQRIGACADLGHYIRSADGVILGKGHLDLEGVFFAMQDVGFPANGALSLEYEENPSDPLDDIRQCVTVAKAAMKKVAT